MLQCGIRFNWPDLHSFISLHACDDLTVRRQFLISTVGPGFRSWCRSCFLWHDSTLRLMRGGGYEVAAVSPGAPHILPLFYSHFVIMLTWWRNGTRLNAKGKFETISPPSWCSFIILWIFVCCNSPPSWWSFSIARLGKKRINTISSYSKGYGC